MRARIVLFSATTALIVVGASVVVSNALAGSPDNQPSSITAWQTPASQPSSPPEPAPPTTPPAPRPDMQAEVHVDIEGFLTWAAKDRRTGELVWQGEETNTTESMIKPWIVADHLRRRADAGTDPTDEELTAGRLAIRDSDNDGTQELYAIGGHNEVVQRMIDMCGLTDTEIYPYWWSRTELTAVDAVRLGECVIEGTAAGPQWTDWVVKQMRKVRGGTGNDDQQTDEGVEGGRWGIIDGLPDVIDRDDVAIKNGWTRIGDTNSWHLNCLAVTPDWVIAVLMRYPAEYSLDYGAKRCASVTSQVFYKP